MFKGLLARVGVGAAKVDTRFEPKAYFPGEVLRGDVHIQGGAVSQKLGGTELLLCTKAKSESDEGGAHWQEIVLARVALPVGPTINANEQRIVPFEILLPLETPLTEWRGSRLFCDVYVRTALDIEGGVDAADADAVRVAPLPVQERILSAFLALGLAFQKADVEWGEIAGSGIPFYQEIEFYGAGSSLRGINEVEVSFIPHDDALEVVLEVDHRSHGGWTSGSQDSYMRFMVDTQTYMDVPWEEEIFSMLSQRARA